MNPLFGQKFTTWISAKTFKNDYVAITTFDFGSMGAQASHSCIIRDENQLCAASRSLHAAIEAMDRLNDIISIVPDNPPHMHPKKFTESEQNIRSPY